MIPLRNADPLQLLQNQRHQHIVADWGKWVENSCCDNNDCFCEHQHCALKIKKIVNIYLFANLLELQKSTGFDIFFLFEKKPHKQLILAFDANSAVSLRPTLKMTLFSDFTAHCEQICFEIRKDENVM